MSEQDWVFWIGFGCGVFTTCLTVAWGGSAWRWYKGWRDRRQCTCGLMRERKKDDSEDGG